MKKDKIGIIHKMSNETFYEPKTFEDAAKPLMQWMAENNHPHTTAIVTATIAELVEGIDSINTVEFLVD